MMTMDTSFLFCIRSEKRYSPRLNTTIIRSTSDLQLKKLSPLVNLISIQNSFLKGIFFKHVVHLYICVSILGSIFKSFSLV